MATSSPQLPTDFQPLLFNSLGSRQVVTDFSAGHLSSDGGMLLLRQVDEGLGISRSLAGCFSDLRNPLPDRTLPFANWWPSVCWGWPLATRISMIIVFYGSILSLPWPSGDAPDPLGTGRAPQDQGKALASASTLNRLELGNNKKTAYHRISANHEAIQGTLLRKGVSCLPREHSKEVVIDLDASDDPLHGQQEGRFFHGYYGCYCYLPLFAFVGSVPLWAELRTSDGMRPEGPSRRFGKSFRRSVNVAPKRRSLSGPIAGFCREEIMAWCEAQPPKVYYCLGLARNSRLRELLEVKFARVRESAILCGGVARGFTEFQYQTLKSWTLSRRVIGKAECFRGQRQSAFYRHQPGCRRFWRQPQSPDRFCAQKCYQDFYCARGNMENQIKQQYLDLDARSHQHPLDGE